MGQSFDAMREAVRTKEAIIGWRHGFHMNPEIGMDLPATSGKVKQELERMGIPYEEIIPHGIKARIGRAGGRHILLRADMDALPIEEKTGLSFASKVPGAMHACGHDTHTAMLLGAAEILKQYESTLDGMITLMFQPGEEGYDGAKKMIEAGVLDPKPDCAVMVHIAPMEEHPSGILAISSTNPMGARDKIKVKVTGVGGHGASPHECRNPIYAAVKIIEAFTDISRFEVPAAHPVILTICNIKAGESHNVIPDECVFGGTLRTHNQDSRDWILQRLRDCVGNISDAYQVSGEFSIESSLPILLNDKKFTKKLHLWLKQELKGATIAPLDDYSSMGSEDFAFISQLVPSCNITLVSQSLPGRHHPLHSAKVELDDEALVYGTAAYVQSAISYLSER